MTSLPGSPLEPFASLAEHLQQITEALAATSTDREVIDVVLTPAVQALGAVAGIVLLVDRTDQQLKIAGSQGYEDGHPTIWQEGSIENHVLLADLLRMREALYFEDAGALKASYPDLERRTGGRALVANAALPMFLDHRPLGVIVLDFTEPHHFPPEERRFLRILAAQCAIALGRAEATRMLEARVQDRTRQWEEQTRQLEEERAAHAAFVAFTEAVGSETDLSTLVERAITLLHETCDVEAVYFERNGELFTAAGWSPSADPTLLPLLQQGFPLQHSSIARGLQGNTATYIDHWRDTGLLIQESAIYQAVAGYPYFMEDTLQSVLLIGSRTSATWDERRKGIFRAVGRSLDLALDRARQTRIVTAQRDALNARTQELADSTAELQAFSYSVSHDLRTPVRHMTGFLELARKALDGRLDERSARYLDIVEQSGRQMNTLIDGLLDLSHAAQRTLEPGVVDLNEVMAQIQTTLLPDLLTRNVTWEVADLPQVWGDRGALAQVLTQLTENALKFTRTRDPARIQVWADDQGGVWRVCVKDNGLGFDPRYQDRLFNLFQRLHRADEVSGTGVGLASVRRLILKHGGQVFAQGQLGEGATFGFTLPKRRPAEHATWAEKDSH
ncbi:GAF domain-containing protein (plasmid) [Deinococcus taeanensis]|uniref:ATP-binding protein n=1 Tax=Deinococcus taeanensis TaxID=2737050 RepID=UPI001CDC7BC7|nr:ATP-binding protein [Deinococcus taeanensis]UBV44124.1 GAF domain-containing protein [Deinococcus taeanensis]